MKPVQNGWLALAAALAIATAGVACERTPRGTEQDPAEAADEMRDDATGARQDADDRADDAERTAGDRIGAATETIDVKTALMADSNVDASNIEVDTFHETRTVVLKGTVPTEAQKAEAERIATREAEGYRIDNQLTVRPPS